MVSDIPAGDGKTVNLFLPCTLFGWWGGGGGGGNDVSKIHNYLTNKLPPHPTIFFTPTTREQASVYNRVPGHAFLDVAHDGVVVLLLLLHLPYNSSWKFHQLAPGQLLSGLYWYGTEKGRRYGPYITYKITPAGSLSSCQSGWPPCWARLLAFGLIAYEYHDLSLCPKVRNIICE